MLYNPISTREIVDSLRNWLEDQSVMGLIPVQIYNKRIFEISPANGVESVWALQAINRADMQVLDLIRMDSQIIAYVPEGESEMLMYSQKSHVFIARIKDIPKEKLSSSQQIFFINHDSWLDAGQLRSDYIYVYNQFPVGDSRKTGVMRVVDWDAYESRNTGEEVCYYEALNKRIRLSKPAPSGGMYLTWVARIRPTYASVDDIKEYRVRTPYQHRELLEHFVRKAMVPDGSHSMRNLKRDEPHVISMSLNNIDPPARTISMPWEI